MNRQHPGYSAGEDQKPSGEGGTSATKIILISAVSAVAGAFLVRLMDKTVFARDESEIEQLRAELARERGGARPALPAAAVVAQGDAPPPPGIVRIEIPRERMTDEFWERLAGEGYE
jgi:hypothetical protein